MVENFKVDNSENSPLTVRVKSNFETMTRSKLFVKFAIETTNCDPVNTLGKRVASYTCKRSRKHSPMSIFVSSYMNKDSGGLYLIDIFFESCFIIAMSENTPSGEFSMFYIIIFLEGEDKAKREECMHWESVLKLYV